MISPIFHTREHGDARRKWPLPFWTILLVAFFLHGCVAGKDAFVEGQLAQQNQEYDQAVHQYSQALKESPGNINYRIGLKQAQSKAALAHKQLADELFSSEQYEEALAEYRLALGFDNSLFSARNRLEQAGNYIQAKQQTDQAEDLLNKGQVDKAEELLSSALALVPDFDKALELKENINQDKYALIDGVTLDVDSTEPISINFRQTDLYEVFDVVSRLSGINFILDEEIKSRRITIALEDASFAQVLELLLQTNGLDKKIINKKTIILYPKTRAKQKQFKDQIIQTIFVSNIEAEEAVNMLRTMLQLRKIYVHEELNAIIMRDEPAAIRLAKKMIEAVDRDSSEVVFDLELIEVNHTDTQELGAKLSNYSVAAGLKMSGSENIVDSSLKAGGDATNLTNLTESLNPFYAIPTASFRFLKTLVDAEILASPKIRVRNKKKAKVHVGSREPVITVTINDTQTSENVQYIDVGVKLDVEPIIKLDDTIETKLSLEVSNVSGREKTSTGTAVITISSTNADTTLTLKDGEQTVIGGLIRNDNSVTKDKIPFLSDIPLLGYIFSGKNSNEAKREILLSITPHIVKLVKKPSLDQATIWSGSEDDLKFGRNFGTFVEEYQAGQEVSFQRDKEPKDEVIEEGQK